MCHTRPMSVMDQKQVTQVMRYVRLWIDGFQHTVELAAFAAEDVLAGKETEFSELDKHFMDALDHVMYHTSHSAQAALTLLLKNRTSLTKLQLKSVKDLRRQYRDVSARVTAFIEALHDIYVFRRRPH